MKFCYKISKFQNSKWEFKGL